MSLEAGVQRVLQGLAGNTLPFAALALVTAMSSVMFAATASAQNNPALQAATTMAAPTSASPTASPAPATEAAPRVIASLQSVNVNPDKLAVEGLISRATSQHPAIMAEAALERAAAEDVEVARLQRYPSLSVQTEASGSRHANVLSVEQPLWTGGRLQARIDAASATSTAQSVRTQEVRYELAIRVIDAWQALLQSREREREITKTLEQLDQYLGLIRRRVTAQVSPPIDAELVSARTLQARVDLQSVRASQRVARLRLTQLLGVDMDVSAMTDAEPLDAQIARVPTLVALGAQSGQVLAAAVERHPTVRKSGYQAQALKAQLEAQRAAQLPEVYARLQRQNGTDLNTSTSNGNTVFLGLRYQPGAGFSSAAQTRSAEARAQGQEYSAEVSRRDVRDAIGIDIEDAGTARIRADSLQEAVGSSGLVLDSYARQFVAGRRTWQEVLNAVRENGDNRLALADARAALLGATYRVRVRMSDLDWQRAMPEGDKP